MVFYFFCILSVIYRLGGDIDKPFNSVHWSRPCYCYEVLILFFLMTNNYNYRYVSWKKILNYLHWCWIILAMKACRENMMRQVIFWLLGIKVLFRIQMLGFFVWNMGLENVYLHLISDRNGPKMDSNQWWGIKFQATTKEKYFVWIDIAFVKNHFRIGTIIATRYHGPYVEEEFFLI